VSSRTFIVDFFLKRAWSTECSLLILRDERCLILGISNSSNRNVLGWPNSVRDWMLEEVPCSVSPERAMLWAKCTKILINIARAVNHDLSSNAIAKL